MRAAFLVILLAGLTTPADSKSTVRPLTLTTLRSFDNTTTSRIAVPFGTFDEVQFSQPYEPSLVQIAEAEYDHNIIATDAAWAKCVTKGRWYGCLLDMKEEACGMALRDTRNPPSSESYWQGDLRRTILEWGWHDTYYPPEIHCDFRDQGPEHGVASKNRIQTALQGLEISYLPFGRGGDNECFSVEHVDENLLPDDDDHDEEGKVPLEEQLYLAGGKWYPATGAYYRFAVNRKGGAIFAQGLKKPRAAADQNLGPDVPDDLMPHLQRASDIMWSYWERNNRSPDYIRYYFVNHIRNDETTPLIARALKNHKMDSVPFWPGLELGMETEEAEALLGSPMGSTIAHFLFQHKRTLGVKSFGSITIFRDNMPEWPPEVQLLFKIIDVPLDEQIDSDVDMPDALDGKAKRGMLYQARVRGGGRNFVREHRIVVGV